MDPELLPSYIAAVVHLHVRTDTCGWGLGSEGTIDVWDQKITAIERSMQARMKD
jgi:hypothetical protein